MKKRVLLGTKNQAKINIVQEALESLPIEILSLRALHIDIDVREDGKSTEENAEKKAKAYYAKSGISTLAIDGGLDVEKFPDEKQPGVFVRRIGGTDRDVTDEEILDYYVRELERVGGESIGIWRGSIALVTSDAKVFSQTFSFKTILTSEKRGPLTPGAPLNSLMIDPVTRKHYSEMNSGERPDFEWILGFVKQHFDEL